MKENCLTLIQSIADMQNDILVVFKDSQIILSNQNFNNFFGVSSTQEYQENFGDFVNNFVPHPSYFNKEKIQNNDLWFDAILKLEEIDRIVSMLSKNFEPYAFSVHINTSIDGFVIVNLVDITQTLVKRLMIQNNANIDKKSGAYSKQYFLQITQSFEDAALFNEKIIGINMIKLSSESEISQDITREFVENFKTFTREDDMLVYWGANKFLLAYLVDSSQKVQLVTKKLQNIKTMPSCSYTILSAVQQDKESLLKIIDNLK